MSERGKRTAARPFYLPLKSSSQKLVTTTYAPKWPRDTGRYDSSERLPDIEALFDRTLNQIQHIHDTRKCSPEFDHFWSNVCDNLKEKRNASAYAKWRQDAFVVRKMGYKTAQEELAKAWEKMIRAEHEMHIGITDTEHRDAAHDVVYRAQVERDKTVTAVSSPLGIALEIAIAYWIEGQNAYLSNDTLRAMHCLIEVHFFLGIVHSPRTESEAKSEAGAKSGKVVRDALAAAALQVMREIIVDRSLQGPDFLLGKIAHLISINPAYSGLLEALSNLNPNDRSAQWDASDQLAQRLRSWVRKKSPPYKELADVYNGICRKMEEISASRKRPQSKSSS